MEMMKVALIFLFGVIFQSFECSVHGFQIPVQRRRPMHTAQRALPDHQILEHSISIATEFFDGSSIVDPVIVSDVFWTSLNAKLVSFLIGQAIAGAVFTAILFFFRSKIAELADFAAKNVLSALGINNNNNSNNERGKEFIKATDDAYVRPPPDLGKLLICVAIDVIGSSSELLPVVGEVTDAFYAPIAASILRSLYGGSNVLFALEFVEEILPFTDIIPLATICWVVDTFFPTSDIAKLFRVGQFNPNYVAPVERNERRESDSIIDVEPAPTRDRETKWK